MVDLLHRKYAGHCTLSEVYSTHIGSTPIFRWLVVYMMDRWFIVCKMWNLTLRKGHKLQVLSDVFEPKKEETTRYKRINCNCYGSEMEVHMD